MSEFKGTPGPWRLGDDAFGKDWPGCLNGHIGVNAPRHALIAQVVWRMSDGDTHRKDYPELQANARLIAAAPDLLECLIELRQWISQEIAHPNSPCGRADTAIAKALGEEK